MCKLQVQVAILLGIISVQIGCGADYLVASTDETIESVEEMIHATDSSDTESAADTGTASEPADTEYKIPLATFTNPCEVSDVPQMLPNATLDEHYSVFTEGDGTYVAIDHREQVMSYYTGDTTAEWTSEIPIEAESIYDVKIFPDAIAVMYVLDDELYLTRFDLTGEVLFHINVMDVLTLSGETLPDLEHAVHRSRRPVLNAAIGSDDLLLAIPVTTPFLNALEVESMPLIAAISIDGSLSWLKQLEQAMIPTEFFSLQNGGYALSGTSNTGAFGLSSDMILDILDAQRDLVQSLTLLSKEIDGPLEVWWKTLERNDGSFYVAGNFMYNMIATDASGKSQLLRYQLLGGGGSSRLFIIHLDAQLHINWLTYSDLTESKGEFMGNGFQVGPAGEIFFRGTFFNSALLGTGEHAMALKYRPTPGNSGDGWGYFWASFNGDGTLQFAHTYPRTSVTESTWFDENAKMHISVCDEGSSSGFLPLTDGSYLNYESEDETYCADVTFCSAAE